MEISKSKKEKYKSLALKERKVLSEEETTSLDSNDDEYAMAVRDFKKFFRRRGKFVRQPYDDKKEKDDQRCFKCGDPNHFIMDYMMAVKEIEDGLLEEIEKFGWWFEQDIGGESEDDREKRLVTVSEEGWMS
ncbi:hypothetical protein Tco_0858551 [Tanacetum coccineum]|uniref:Alpha/beta hydrolases superfamily protein n=1 Tax=Tanacetum coccineum TaxID=301880 RepID=A0ABQ5BB99_9ASTR